MMNPATGFSVIRYAEERAVPQRPALSVHPEIDAGNMREVVGRDICPDAPRSVGKPDRDVPEDVGASAGYPGQDILSNPLLVKAPFLAAPPALPALLIRRHWHSPRDYMLKYLLGVFYGA
jgi:hypothetical protein